MFRHTTPTLVGLAFGFLLASEACSNRTTTEMCYEADPFPDEVGFDAPVCQWRRPPEGPEGTTTWYVQVCVPVADNESCDHCDVEEIDRLLEERIAVECCEPIEGFIRGCHWRKTYSDERGDECCYGAAYFSKCTEPGVADDPACPAAP